MKRIALSWICLLVTLSLPIPSAAQGGLGLTARLSLDGYCKDDHWIPLRVQLDNPGADLEGDLRAELKAASGSDTIYAQAVSLPAGARKVLLLNIRPAGYANQVDLDFVSGSQVLAQAVLPLNCVSRATPLYGVMSNEPSAFTRLAAQDPSGDRAELAFLEPADLPDQATALSALDLMVISGIDTGELTAAQRQALSGWVANGGRLIVTGGSNWQKTAAGIADLIPLQPQTVVTLDDLEPFNIFTTRPGSLSGTALVAQGKLSQSGTVLVQGELPLVIQRDVGAGQVWYLAVDPSQEPLKSWEGLDEFYRRLLAPPGLGASWGQGFQDWNAAETALTNLPNLGLPNAGLVLGFLCLYVLVVGPINYLFLRLLKRRELAWISIPLVVGVFSLAAFTFGLRALGAQPVISRLAIVHAGPGAGQARVDGLLGVFSPGRATYNLSVQPGFLMHPLPDLGRPAIPNNWQFRQERDGSTSLPDLRIDAAGIRSVALEGQIPAPDIRADLTLHLDGSQAVLRGRLFNDSPLRLEGAVLLTPGGPLQLGVIEPSSQMPVELTYAANRQAAAGLPAVPGMGKFPAAVSSAAPYLGPYNDPWLINLLGTSDFYRDARTFRRFNLLSATYTYNQPTGQFPETSYYLAGWSDQAPFVAELNGQRFKTDDSSLYLISLTSQVAVSGDHLVLPPTLFTWSHLDDLSIKVLSPYDTALDPALYAFQFRLAQPIPYSQVLALSLHLSNYGLTGPLEFQVSLWDFTQKAWVEQPDLHWGENSIPQASRFVGSQGEIRVQLDNRSNPGTVTLQSADFTLEVRP